MEKEREEEGIMNLRKTMLIGAVLLTVLAAAAYSLQGTFARHTGGPRVLVAYFSHAGENYAVGRVEKGSTAALAEMIAEETGGDLFEIKPKNDYPERLKDVLETARREQKENARPELAENVRNLADYDVIFLGYPVWCSDMPMPVYTFLETNDFSGKTIIPFATALSDSLTGNENNIPEHAKGAKVLNGIGLEGKFVHDTPRLAAPMVSEWLENVGWKDVGKAVD